MTSLADVVRPATLIGDVWLSVQASEFAYCSPRVTGLPFEDYTAYEIALWRDRPAEVEEREHLLQRAALRRMVAPLVAAADPFDPFAALDDPAVCVEVTEASEEIREHGLEWLKPSDVIETAEFDSYFEDDQVAGYVPSRVVAALRRALRYHFGLDTPENRTPSYG